MDEKKDIPNKTANQKDKETKKQNFIVEWMSQLRMFWKTAILFYCRNPTYPTIANVHAGTTHNDDLHPNIQTHNSIHLLVPLALYLFAPRRIASISHKMAQLVVPAATPTNYLPSVKFIHLWHSRLQLANRHSIDLGKLDDLLSSTFPFLRHWNRTFGCLMLFQVEIGSGQSWW